MKKIYLALGSNLGNREENLQECVDRLETIGVHVLQCSSTYETKPMYVLEQGQFLNLVLEAETNLFPRTLIKKLKALERELGRKQAQQNRPRLIDVDVLFYGRFIIETKELTVPHPRLEERRFVLEPLAELAPELRHPVSRQTIKDILAKAPPQGVKRLGFLVTLPEKQKGANDPL